MKIKLKFVFFALLIVFAFSGCSTLSQAEKMERRVEKEAKKEMQQAQKAYKKALKRHKKNQGKQTKAQTKETKRESAKWNNSRKRSPRNKSCNHD